MQLLGSTSFLSKEIGLNTLLNSNKDVFLIIILRMLRLIAFGGASLILALYLKEIGFDERLIGLFMTFTFVGDLVSSFWLSLVTDRFGRRRVLILSTVLMTLTGLGFVLFENHIVLMVIATLGIITPSGAEVGPFRSIEQSSIASLVSVHERSDIYSWYTFLGFSCSAIGTIIFGHLVDYLQLRSNLTLADSYRATFVAYTLLSLASIPMAIGISSKIECDEYTLRHGGPGVEGIQVESEQEEVDPLIYGSTTPTVPVSTEAPSPTESTTLVNSSYVPTLDASTAAIVIKLSIFFGLDAFASSLVPMSWTTYYIKNKFHISASLLGSVFFTTSFICGITSLLSTTLTKRFGPVLTMVGTHLPASILLTMIPVSTSFQITLWILIVRSSTQSMDVAPKHVFLAALVPDNQRTAIFAWVNVLKTLAQSFGPIIVGVLTAADAQWITFVTAGTLKIIYDLGMLGTFWEYNHHSAH